jgi:hypothetical protein
MRSPIRVAWRSGTLAVKVDECRSCGRVGRHKVERQYRWLEVGPVGILPLGMRHGLECGECWAWSPIGFRAARRGVRAGRLPLPDRPRPRSAAAAAAGARTPDFDRVVPSRSLDGGTAYLGVWALLVVIVLGLAAQPGGGTEADHASSSTCLVVVGISEGQPVPTPPVLVSETLCVLPHNFEPLARVPLTSFAPSATVPPYPVVEVQARAACDAAFKTAFGTPAAGGPAAILTGADPRDWARGERFTWCAAADPAHPWPNGPLPR